MFFWLLLLAQAERRALLPRAFITHKRNLILDLFLLLIYVPMPQFFERISARLVFIYGMHKTLFFV
ncbi:hypothetical protein C6W88_04745 [Halomonas litopenaei]|uniref:Uncharacterized protein n=1 Tax=Halomonas litopenaei TaxID=2109328 RepID=A0ABX5J296_9GAMM|nr:hypothetical protein [Halomonas litopenaei]PTL93669.1 hypothetical protein C6W89_00420 [Halomonas sp. SYSU XM8]PTL95759.1 hypothetical protein C6W88_04745 [Halomonas litopenaei]